MAEAGKRTKRNLYKAHSLAYRLSELLKEIGEKNWSRMADKWSLHMYREYLEHVRRKP